MTLSIRDPFGLLEPLPRVRAVPPAGPATPPREVENRGHAFDPDLRCRCGTTWGAHQQDPRPCTRRHLLSTSPAAPPRPSPRSLRPPRKGSLREHDDEILELWNAGAKKAAIAERFGVSYSSITLALQRIRKVNPPGAVRVRKAGRHDPLTSKSTAARNELILARRLAGKTLRAIGEEFDLCESTVSYILLRFSEPHGACQCRD